MYVCMVNRDLLNASQAEAKNLRYVCNFSFCIYYIYMCLYVYVCMQAEAKNLRYVRNYSFVYTIYTYVCVCMYVCRLRPGISDMHATCTHVCLCEYAYMRYLFRYICLAIHTYIHTQESCPLSRGQHQQPTYMHTYMNTCTHT